MFKIERSSDIAQKQQSKHSGRSIVQKSSTSTTSNDAVELTASTASVIAPLSNHLTVLAQALAAAMALETDLRYHLSWAYGAYLNMVPCRLGMNEALDTAVDALVTTHVGFSCSRKISMESLAKYSRALGALRKCLDDPDLAVASETLCAVSLLLITQVRSLRVICKITNQPLRDIRVCKLPYSINGQATLKAQPEFSRPAGASSPKMPLRACFCYHCAGP